MTTWRDDIDLACLDAFDSIEHAEVAAATIASICATSLQTIGLPADLYDQIDAVIEPERIRRLLGDGECE